MERFNPLYYLLFQARRPMRIVNAISFFRVIAFPALILLLFLQDINAFKWLILTCFITDTLDGFLARKFKVTSILGSRLDSLGDDLTVFASFLGVIVFHSEFVLEQWVLISLLWFLYFVQLGFALIKYQKITSFHTYSAKVATVFQGVLLCSLFFLDEPQYLLFYAATLTTAINLVEEMLMVYVLRSWRSDIKGLYWALKLKASEALQDDPES